MSQFTLVVAGYPQLADALERTGQFAQVVRVASTSELRNAITSGLGSLAPSQLGMVFADTMTVDTEQSLEFLLNYLASNGYPTVIVDVSGDGVDLVDDVPAVGLLPVPVTANLTLAALAGMDNAPKFVPSDAGHDPVVLPDGTAVGGGEPAAQAPEGGFNPFASQQAQEQPAPPQPTQEQPAPPQPAQEQPAANPFASAQDVTPEVPDLAATPQQPQPAPAPQQDAAPSPFATQQPQQPPAPQQPEQPAPAPQQPQPAPQQPEQPAPAPQQDSAPSPFATQQPQQPAPQPQAPQQPAPQAPANPFATGDQPQQPAQPPQQPQTPSPFGGGQTTQQPAQPQQPPADPFAPAGGQAPAASPFGGPANDPQIAPLAPTQPAQPSMPAMPSHGGPQLPEHAAPSRRGLVVAVCAPKGGVGKSGLALNLAAHAGLRLRQAGMNAAVVDANVQQPDVGKYVNRLVPSIADLGKHRGTMTPDVVRKNLVHIPEYNLSALLGPPKISQVNPQWMRGAFYLQIVEVMREMYDIVILDTPVAELIHDLFDNFVLKSADFIVCVAAPNSATLVNVDDWLGSITASVHTPEGRGFPKDKVGYILNRAEEGIDCDLDEVRNELGRWRMLGAIPESKAWKRANNNNTAVAGRGYDDLNGAFDQVLYSVTGWAQFTPTYQDQTSDDAGVLSVIKRLFKSGS